MTPSLNLPAPGRRQTLYVVFDFAESCVFSKQSPGPVHCGPRQLGARSPPPAGAHLLPKLRCQFAEFLNEGSLTRLGILSLSTCVGLRYGHPEHSLEVFLGSMGSATLQALGLRVRLSALTGSRICLGSPPTGLNPHFQSRAAPTLLRHPIVR